MKISIASNGNSISEHFSSCEGFTVYYVEENEIIDKKFIYNPGHKPGFLPMFLKDMGVNVVIAYEMGEKAQNLFKENKIEVISGIKGISDIVIGKYINKELETVNIKCTPHCFK